MIPQSEFLHKQLAGFELLLIEGKRRHAELARNFLQASARDEQMYSAADYHGSLERAILSKKTPSKGYS